MTQLPRRVARACRRLLRQDSGATLVEYALGIALIVVVMIAAIEFFTDESSAEFQDRTESMGSPDLEEGLPGGSTGGTTGGATTGGTSSGPTAPTTLTANPPTSSGSHANNSWDATVTLSMNGDGNLVEGLQITGRWTIYVEGVAQPQETAVSCTTGPNGECVFTRDDMEWRTNKPEVTKAVFTVTGYTYTASDPSQTYTIPPAPAQTVEVTRPTT
jgi:Flp pilus assembly pilin Flp